MRLKTFLTAAALSLSGAVALPQAGQALPAAPHSVDRPAPLVTPVHDGIYWRYRRPYYRGYPGYPYRRPGYRYYGGYWFPPGSFYGGVIVIVPPYQRTYQLTERHYRWCEHRYRSYRRWDNTFQPYHGPRKQCVSPYLY